MSRCGTRERKGGIVISYPGDVLARFGRYEAVQDHGTLGRAHVWRAWDPFIERFVLVAVLEDLQPVEVIRGWQHVEAALTEWTGGHATSVDSVLDFAPPASAPAFLVLRLRPDDGDGTGADVPTASASGDAPGGGESGGGAPRAGWRRFFPGLMAILLAGAELGRCVGR